MLGLVFMVRDWLKHGNPEVDARVSSYREKVADYAAYTSTSKADVTAYLDEQEAMGSIGFQYQPWVQFRNPAVRGRLLNTDQEGFRATRARAAPRQATDGICVRGLDDIRLWCSRRCHDPQLSPSTH